MDCGPPPLKRARRDDSNDSGDDDDDDDDASQKLKAMMGFSGFGKASQQPRQEEDQDDSGDDEGSRFSGPQFRPRKRKLEPSSSSNSNIGGPSHQAPSGPTRPGPPRPPGPGRPSSTNAATAAVATSAGPVGPPRPKGGSVGPPRPSVGPSKVGPPRPKAPGSDSSAAGLASVKSEPGLDQHHHTASPTQGGFVKVETKAEEDVGSNLAVNQQEAAWGQERRRAGIPAEDSLFVAAHAGSISALACDRTGARFASGGIDSQLCLWDFAGLKRPVADTASPVERMLLDQQYMTPYRKLEVVEGNPVHSIEWSCRGDMLLVTTSAVQARIYNREGSLLGETVSGDRYVFDLTRTDGHIASLTAGCWHPIHESGFFTAGLDGSVRLWSTETLQRKNLAVFKCRNQINAHIPVTSLCVTPSESTSGQHAFAAGCEDGSIHVWSISRSEKLPQIAAAQRTHPKPTIGVLTGVHSGAVTSLKLFHKGSALLLLSRSVDGSMKLFELDKNKIRSEPRARPTTSPHPCLVREWWELPARSERTMCGVSPDGVLAFTGVSAGGRIDSSGLLPGEARSFVSGFVYFFRTDPAATSDVAAVLPVSALLSAREGDASSPSIVPEITSCLWHPKLHQLLVGTASGGLHVFFDPRDSHHGALLAVRQGAEVSEAAKRKSANARTTGARPADLEGDLASLLRQRADAAGAMPGHEVRRFRAEMNRGGDSSVTTHGVGQSEETTVGRDGFGGKLGSGGSAARAMLAGSMKIDPDLLTGDIRERILRHQPTNFFTAAYQDTQPTVVLDYEGGRLDEQEQERALEKKSLQERQQQQAGRR